MDAKERIQQRKVRKALAGAYMIGAIDDPYQNEASLSRQQTESFKPAFTAQAIDVKPIELPKVEASVVENPEVTVSTEVDKRKRSGRSTTEPTASTAHETSHGKRGKAFNGDLKAFMDYMTNELLTKYGVTKRHAKALASQFALETDYGKKMTGEFNYGNIVSRFLKGDGTYGTTNWKGDEVKLPSNSRYFRSYKDMDEAMRDTFNLMKNRYDIDVTADDGSLSDEEFLKDFTSKLTGHNSTGYKWAEDSYGDRIRGVHNKMFA